MTDSPVIVYSSLNCPKCLVVKNFLKQNNIEYEERSISNPTYMQEVVIIGIMSVPVIKYKEYIFNANNIQGLLDVL
ncbi:MAG: glutaredoxin family protein [Cellulosilyticaceae bacterium]